MVTTAVPGKKNILATVLAICAFLAVVATLYYPQSNHNGKLTLVSDSEKYLYGKVTKVVDGDTIEVLLADGEREVVRYIGIDTPEYGESFYNEARRKNIDLVGGKTVRLLVCAAEPRDKYGRILAWVFIDTVEVEAVLLREGLARTLMIPPCGLNKEKEYLQYYNEALAAGAGMWRKKRYFYD